MTPIHKRQNTTNNTEDKKITPQELINFGIDAATYWSSPKDKAMDTDILILGTLKNNCSLKTQKLLFDFFTPNIVVKAIKEHKDYLSASLAATVIKNAKHVQ